MKQLGKYFTALASAVATATLLSACGGGDAGAPFSPTASTGYAVDGYLDGSSIKCDASGVVVKTDSAGFFRFPEGCDSTLTLTGGTNVDTKLSFTGTLRAPAGSKMVTPLTTLLAGGMTQSQVNASLGLPEDTDLTNTDPALTSAGTLDNPDLFKKTLAVQQLLLQTTEAMAAFAGDSTDATRQAIYSEVAASFAAGMKSGAKLNATSTTVNLAVLKTLVTDAGTRLAASTLVPTSVKTAIGTVRADTFAEVISGGMKAQAEVLLTMANSDVTSVTTAQQTDTKVKTAVTATSMSEILKLAPDNSDVTDKAKALTDSITGMGGMGTGTGTGTTLVTFDEATAPTLTGFGGAEDSTVVADPAGGTNKVAKVVKSVTAELWAGTTVSTGANQSIATIPFTATAKTMTVRVWSPTANIPVRLKVEDASDNTKTVETEATTTVANAWETLTFNFATQASGTAALNLANTYNKASIFFNFGTTGAAGGGGTFYFDDVTFLP